MEDLFARAETAFDLGRYELAKELILDYLASYPDDSDAIAFSASCSSNLDDTDEAIVLCGRAIELDPENAYAYYVLALARQAKGDYLSARKNILEAVRLCPQAATYLHHAACLASTDSPDFLRYLDQALANDPEHLDSLRLKYAHLCDLGDQEKEAESLKKTILKLSPDDSFMHGEMGWQCLSRRETLDEAMAHFQTSLSKDPGDEQFIRGLEEVQYRKETRLGFVLEKYSWAAVIFCGVLMLVFFFSACALVDYLFQVRLPFWCAALLLGAYCGYILLRLAYRVWYDFRKYWQTRSLGLAVRTRETKPLRYSTVLGAIIIGSVVYTFDTYCSQHGMRLPPYCFLVSEPVAGSRPTIEMLGFLLFSGYSIMLLACGIYFADFFIHKKKFSMDFLIVAYMFAVSLILFGSYYPAILFKMDEWHVLLQVLFLYAVMVIPCLNPVEDIARDWLARMNRD